MLERIPGIFKAYLTHGPSRSEEVIMLERGPIDLKSLNKLFPIKNPLKTSTESRRYSKWVENYFSNIPKE